MRKCNVCNQTESKYRCPQCRILYCSVACYKTHKDNSCEELKSPKETISHNAVTNGSSLITKDVEPGELTEEDLNDEDKVSQEKLSLLEKSQKIKDMLSNKHLQRVLKTIDEKDSEQELEAAMKLPLFVEFANECLKLVDD